MHLPSFDRNAVSPNVLRQATWHGTRLYLDVSYAVQHNPQMPKSIEGLKGGIQIEPKR